MLPELSRRDFLKMATAIPFSNKPLELLFQNSEVRINTSVLFYHEVNASRMTSDILNFIQRGVQPISLETLVLGLRGEIEIPPLPTFMVTCDDGLRTQYTEGLRAINRVAELSDWFVPATFFIMTRFNGQPITEDMLDSTPSFNDNRHDYMNKGQLVDLIQQGHYVQNHTSDHISVNRLSGKQLVDQVELAEEKLDSLWEVAGVERTVKAFAYPNGAYSGRAEYIESVGIDIAFSVENSTILSSNRRFMLGRVRKS